MKSGNVHPINRYRQILLTIIILLLGIVLCAYMTISAGSPSPSPSRIRITQTSPPTELATDIHPALDITSQGTIFNQIWTIINENYLYTDFNGLDWNTIHSEYLQKIEAGLSEDDFYREMEELVGKLGNKHTKFLSPIDNYFTAASPGILLVSIPGENRADVVLVFPNSSAGRAGILPRDRILAVNGKQAPDNYNDLISLINGVPGTTVFLTVQTPGQEPRQLEVTRGVIQEPMPVLYRGFTSPGGKNIGYLVLASFYTSSLTDQITSAILALSTVKPLDGLILDVRANVGGKQTTLDETLSHFTHGTIGYYTTRNGKMAIEIPDRDIFGSSHIPLVVLTSHITSSGGAIFAGELQDMGKANLIGEKTDDAMDSAHLYSLTDGSALEVAVGAIHPINHPDLVWNGKGVIPDLEVKMKWDEFMSNNDPAIRAALDYFDR